MDLSLVGALLVLGGAVGFLAGLLGIGGGMTMVPLLTIVFTRQGFAPEHIVHMAVATATATTSSRPSHRCASTSGNRLIVRVGDCLAASKRSVMEQNQ